jgi:hypothetical protein
MAGQTFNLFSPNKTDKKYPKSQTTKNDLKFENHKFVMRNTTEMASTRLHEWKNASVNLFAAGEDPIALMLEKATEVTLDAQQHGWGGPRFDPFALAEIRHIPVIPNADILDARVLPVGADKFRIEYNPNRPKARIRYSLAHEIAHTLFPDASKQIRLSR